MYKTIRIHTCIHICFIYIYIYIYKNIVVVVRKVIVIRVKY